MWNEWLNEWNGFMGASWLNGCIYLVSLLRLLACQQQTDPMHFYNF